MSNLDFKEFHWMVSMINNIDAGLIVFDTNYIIKSWNGFMFHHSNIEANDAKGQSLFSIFPDLDKHWFMRKIDAVKTIKNQSFITWEQKPYIFPFKNYRPITGTVEHMYQNVTILPLPSVTGDIDQICLIIYDVTDIASNRQALQRANLKLEQLTTTDPLTQLHNRGGLENSIVLAKKYYTYKSIMSSLIMINIDGFKKINDSYGHRAGDYILQQIAQVLDELKRVHDSVARYGNNEFALILHNCTNSQAFEMLEKVREQIHNTQYQFQEQHFNITISFGIAQIATNTGINERWIESADKALYQSTNQGINQGLIFEYLNKHP